MSPPLPYGASPNVPVAQASAALSSSHIGNPYEEFTGPQFDEWISNITSQLRRALEYRTPNPAPQSSEAQDATNGDDAMWRWMTRLRRWSRVGTPLRMQRGKVWTWWEKYGEELFACLSALDIPPMKPLPPKKRGKKRAADEPAETSKAGVPMAITSKRQHLQEPPIAEAAAESSTKRRQRAPAKTAEEIRALNAASFLQDDMNRTAAFFKDARTHYVDIDQHRVTVHLADSPRHYGPALTWNTVKHKNCRSLNSVILPEGVVADLVHDAKEFISAEKWDWKNERNALTFEFSYMDYIRKSKAGRSKERVWQNVPIPDSLPGQGFCFPFIMRWLLELPEKGLEWCHKHGTLESLKGFVQLKS
ncbi:hypothetical protein B0H14DRAFT_3718354 [Mycena olivaceomarginata]|nr:hypothetical protein B0H14DRAFT_3718354 [Mycena olivaceomarginata]